MFAFVFVAFVCLLVSFWCVPAQADDGGGGGERDGVVGHGDSGGKDGGDGEGDGGSRGEFGSSGGGGEDGRGGEGDDAAVVARVAERIKPTATVTAGGRREILGGGWWGGWRCG